jgi:hypothetical protein
MQQYEFIGDSERFVVTSKGAGTPTPVPVYLPGNLGGPRQGAAFFIDKGPVPPLVWDVSEQES